MEIFKTETMKKEYKEYLKLLDDVLECGFCRIDSCKHHKKHKLTCTLCRDAQCKKCKKLLISKDVLVKNCDQDGQDFIFNFTVDYLNLSPESRAFFFPEKEEIEIKKIEKELFKKKVKSEKNSSKIVKQVLPGGVKNGQYQVGRRKRHFYY